MGGVLGHCYGLLVCCAFLGSLSFATSKNGYGRLPIVASGLTADRLVAAIHEEGLWTIPLVLQWIDTNAPQQLEHFTLMRESRSLQEASPLFPRAIVFGTDASFILTFNGSPSQAGFDRLEMLQFRPAGERKPAHFETREIVFASHNSIAKGKRSPLVSEPNPAKCVRCHLSPSRPIWDPYEIWEGAYGKRDDSMIDFDNDRYSRVTDNDVMVEARRDLSDYGAFRAMAATDDRYRFLKFRKDSPVAPYATQIRSFDYTQRPNLRLTGLLTLLQAEQVASHLTRESGCYDHYKELVIAASIPCSLNELVGREKLDMIHAGAEAALVARFPWRADIVEPEPHYSDSAREVAPVLALAMDRSAWHMGRKGGDSWSYFEGLYYQFDFVGQRLYEHLAKDDASLFNFEVSRGYDKSLAFAGSRPPALKETEYGQTPESFDDACHELGRRIREKFAESTAAPAVCSPAPHPSAAKTTIGMCLSCHGADAEKNGRTIPDLDWESAAGRQKISERIASHDPTRRMPPDRFLTDHEKEALLLYLK